LIAFLVVAFVGESTGWWWWLVPVFGTVKIFGASVMLGMLYGCILLVVLVGALVLQTRRARYEFRHKSA
jgi:FtsH-binding integral membrane protein